MKARILACFVAGLVLAFSGGCGQKAAAPTNVKTEASFLELQDAAGRTVVLPKPPQRVVALSPSYLEIIDAIGGSLVGRPASQNGRIPESMVKLPEVGLTYNINMETVVGLKPDLVLAGKNQHDKFVKLLETNNIPTIEFNAKTLDEVKALVLDLGRVYSKQKAAKKLCDKLDSDIAAIKAKLPKEDKPKRIVIMFATASSVSVANSKSVAGCVSDMLGFENVAAKALQGHSEKTPYSMEALLEQNPDLIFITSMGKPKKIEERLRKDFRDNPAWNSLKAVQEKKIFVLPENLFLLNPGIHYPEAVAYMAQKVYPDLK